ncbi:MAG: polysaccharide lyase 6 family protein [Litorimonas sp.]
MTTQDDFREAVNAIKPGETIVLANGEWDNFEILFQGWGTPEAPITLTAETPGDVVLTGQSNLRLAGAHLVVDGLVFRDGYTPTSSVISFRRDDQALASHSSVFNTVIDGFSNPERFETDSWVQIFGRNNRFENNHLSGKGNQGVTLAVRLNAEESRENNHIIANNYFGPRPILGSNGGETLRIGTSHYSLFDSHTVLKNNVFDRTNGELEIVSVKSGRNVLRNNTFLAARGTLTLRHGNNNVIKRNVFLGDNANHTGGIRVINGGQQVRENYMEALTGIRFGGAFTVMNGVPNSPINRYHPVADARIENNSIIGSDRIQLGAGSDSERSAVPMNSTFHNNLLARDVSGPVFEVYDDMSGIDFADNILMGPGDAVFDTGFARSDAKLSRAANGLLYPPADVQEGAPRDLIVTGLDDVGVDWYPKAPAEVAFGSGKRTEVTLEDGALFAAVMGSAAGDILMLAPGEHIARKMIKLPHPVTIEGSKAATIAFERSALFQIENGGSLRLDGVTVTGRAAPDMVGNSVIRTSPYSMTQNYRLEIVDSDIIDLDINRFFDVVRGAKSTLADYILMEGTQVSNISGSVFNFDDEVDDFGRYNAEYITVKNSQFTNIHGPFATLYRGGRDESTFGPHFEMRGSSFTNVGLGPRNARSVSLWLHGVQDTDLVDNRFTDSAPFLIDHTVGDPQTDIANNRFENTAAPQVIEITSGLASTARLSNNEGL